MIKTAGELFTVQKNITQYRTSYEYKQKPSFFLESFNYIYVDKSQQEFLFTTVFQNANKIICIEYGMVNQAMWS